MAIKKWWSRLWTERTEQVEQAEVEVETEGAQEMEQPKDDVQLREKSMREQARDNAEARADRTLEFARTELATYERELWLASGGKRRVAKRKRD